MSEADDLRHSPIETAHVELDAKLVPFGGWNMPLSYPSGTLHEHRACRTGAVVFDVSHLGTVRVRGANAFAALQAAFTNDLGRIEVGKAQYTHLLDEHDASVLDDIIVWWREDELFDVMPNASNTSRVEAALTAVDGVTAENVTEQRAVFAVQGPEAKQRLATVAPELADIGRFRVGERQWNGTTCVVAGTGYTGEPGLEIAVPLEAANDLWKVIVGAGIEPAGLGARDTLRLEAGLPLHGHELGPGITSLQAKLGWVVRWDKGDFRGREALAVEKESGPDRVLVGLTVEGRRPPREGQPVVVNGQATG
ncbi:MAG: glycine cleavage system aminomethyltransferase GcvT, partial [Acidimicrobiales bacterium]